MDGIRIMEQQITHSDIKDMPDVGGSNRDHDQRYIVKRTTAEVGSLMLIEKSVDPADPVEGHAVIWLSDGTGSGDDGDIMVKSTAGGSTSTGTLLDHTP